MFQFSLRSLLAATAALCALLAWRCNRARLEMETVSRLERLGVVVYTDTLPSVSRDSECILELLDAGRWGSARRLLDHLRSPVTAVTIGLEFRNYHIKGRRSYFVTHDTSNVNKAIDELARLPALSTIYLIYDANVESVAAREMLRLCFPECAIVPVRASVTDYHVLE